MTHGSAKRIVLGATVGRSLSVLTGLPGHLVAEGWEVHVVSSPGAELDAYAQVDGVTPFAIRMARDPSIVQDLRSLAAWLVYLRRVKPHVLFVGTPKAALLANVAGLLCRVPRRIYVLRGLRLESTQGLMFHLLRILEKTTAAASHVVLAVSPSLRAKAVSLGVSRPQKIVVLGSGSSNGVDVARFSPDRAGVSKAEMGIGEDVPVIGFVGRVTDDKGLGALARARVILESRGVDHELVIIGGPDGRAQSYEVLRTAGRQAREVGHVPDTSTYYGLMDLMVLPTRREGFPNTVLEASASAVAVITTDATGAVDSVEHGETGFVVPCDDAYALADAIEVLLMDPARRQDMGRRGRVRVEQSFKQEDVWRRLDLLFAHKTRETQVVGGSDGG